jgi:D-3-phosphoglycerate dehydrogenase
LQQSDIVSLHLPAVPQTSGMVNGYFLQQMKNGAYLINTLRLKRCRLFISLA